MSTGIPFSSLLPIIADESYSTCLNLRNPVLCRDTAFELGKENKTGMSSSLAQSTEEKLYNLIICEKAYLPGARLPNETALAQELGVSRTTLREAVRSLVTQGLLEVRRGSGTYVAAELPADKTRVDFKSLQRSRLRLNSLFEARLIFEPEAAYLACERGSEEEIRKILSLGEQCKKAILANESRVEEDKAFHGAIAEATHNDYLSSMYPLIAEAVFTILDLPSDASAEISRVTLEDHDRIMEAFRTRDSSAARYAMLLHLHRIMKLWGMETYR